MPASTSRAAGLARRLAAHPAWHAVHRVAVVLLSALRALPATRPVREVDPPAGGPRRVVIVVHSCFGMGGTIRSSITQANQLARDGDRVTLVSVTRGGNRPRPFFDVHPDVTLRVLDDPLGPPTGARVLMPLRRVLAALPSVLFHPEETRTSRMSLLRDLLLVREVRRHHRGVLVGTRAGINVVIAHAARPGVARVGQEHVPFASYPPRLLAALRRSYPRLDALMVLTRGDAADASRLLGDAPTAVEVVPNALPDGVWAASDGSPKVVATAGRLSRGKRQDVLVRAFARVAAEHPDWELRIYGQGPRRARLARLVARLDLRGRVRLMGASDRLGEDLAEASIFVLSSELEAFGIVLIEAMRSRLAVISTDCPHGPRELVTDGRDGLLVPTNDVAALAAAIDRLVRDPGERQRLAEAAQRTSRSYEPAVVAEGWRRAYRRAEQVRRSRSVRG